MGLIQNISSNFTFAKISDVVGGRKFIGVILATWLVREGKIPAWAWLVVIIIYFFANILDKNLEKYMPDIVAIAKAKFGGKE